MATFSITRTPDGARAVIRARRNVLLAGFCIWWLGFWSLSVAGYFRRDGIPNALLLIIVPITVYLTIITLWNLWGREIITFTPLGIISERVLLRWRRKMGFELNQISNPTWIDRVPHYRWSEPSGIQFSAKEKSSKICTGLSYHDAKSLISLVVEFCPEQSNFWHGFRAEDPFFDRFELSHPE